MSGGRQRGLTMIEAVVSLVVIAVLGVAALRAFSAATLARALAQDRARGVALAGDLLAEVASAPYGDPPATAAEADVRRGTFDTVGDFHGWSASPPESPDGVPVAPAPWRREVTVTPVALDAATAAAAGSGLLRITVRVYKGDRLVASQTALRTSAWDEVSGGSP